MIEMRDLGNTPGSRILVPSFPPRLDKRVRVRASLQHDPMLRGWVGGAARLPFPVFVAAFKPTRSPGLRRTGFPASAEWPIIEWTLLGDSRL